MSSGRAVILRWSVGGSGEGGGIGALTDLVACERLLARLAAARWDDEEVEDLHAQGRPTLRSRRAADDLHDLARRATVFERVGEVAALRHDIGYVLVAS